MAEIILRFVTEKDPISQAIRDVTWSAFSHVEFMLDDGTTLGAHANGGVRIRPIDYAIFSNEERYRVTVTDDQKATILAYAQAQLGKPYDFTDIFGILLHRDWRKDDGWICSELVAACFEKAMPLLHAAVDAIDRVTPRDVYLSPYLIGNRIWPIPTAAK